MPGEPRPGENLDPVNPEKQENPEIAELREFLDKIKPPYLAQVYLHKGDVLASHQTDETKRGERVIFGGSEKQQAQLRRNEAKISNGLMNLKDRFKLQDSVENKYDHSLTSRTLYGLAVDNINGKDQTALVLDFDFARYDESGRQGLTTLIFFTKKEVAEKLIKFFESQEDLENKVNVFQNYIDASLPGLQPLSDDSLSRTHFGRVAMQEGFNSIEEARNYGGEGFPGIEKVF